MLLHRKLIDDLAKSVLDLYKADDLMFKDYSNYF